MAYKFVVGKYCANRAAVLTELFNFLGDIGWELHDNEDASSYRIYKSNGEGGDRIYEYEQISWSTANVISFRGLYFWNATTNTGVGWTLSAVNLSTSESGVYLWLYGDKNMVYITTKVGSSWSSVYFGHLKRWWNDCLATLTSNATAGSNVQLSVNNTTNFKVGKKYQIVGANGEGRDRLTVTAIGSNTITVSNLPRNYNSGALFGTTPSTFISIRSITDFTASATCDISRAGTENATDYYELHSFLPYTHLDPDARQEEAYILVPFLFSRDTQATIHGYIDERCLIVSSTGLAREDILGVNERDSGTSTGSNTSSTLKDTNKSWASGQFVNNVVLITGGVGAGQIRKITANTSTELTISPDWEIIPNNASVYVIADEGYRAIVTIAGAGWYLCPQEGV